MSELKYKITEHPMLPGSWQVETLNTDEVELVLFGGFRAKVRAEQYVQMVEAENANQLAPAGQGATSETCEHGIRKPHECHDCFSEFAAKQVIPSLSEYLAGREKMAKPLPAPSAPTLREKINANLAATGDWRGRSPEEVALHHEATDAPSVPQETPPMPEVGVEYLAKTGATLIPRLIDGNKGIVMYNNSVTEVLHEVSIDQWHSLVAAPQESAFTEPLEKGWLKTVLADVRLQESVRKKLAAMSEQELRDFLKPAPPESAEEAWKRGKLEGFNEGVEVSAAVHDAAATNYRRNRLLTDEGIQALWAAIIRQLKHPSDRSEQE